MARRRPSPDPLAPLVDALRHGDGAPTEALAGLAGALVRTTGLAVDAETLPLTALAGLPLPERPDLDALVSDLGTGPESRGAADVLGHAHEALLDASHRRAHGVHYTPPAIADGVVGLVASSLAGTGDLPRICDPAVGGGAFLLAAGRALERHGHRRAAIVDHALFGVDVDPVAVAVARTALILWAAEAGEPTEAAGIVVGDSLLGRPAFDTLDSGAGPFVGFDVVVGNPPFQNQLERGTSRATRTDGDTLRRRFGASAFRYTDTAALFLLEACRWARPGGRVSLVLPQSVLVADDAAAVRHAVLELADLTGLWVAVEDVFTASVRVCAPVLHVGGPVTDGVALWRGPGFERVTGEPMTTERLRAEPTWSILTRPLMGAPAVELGDGPTLGSCCTATAGFRDQYYGLAPFVAEAGTVAGATARLVTSGLIDPARCRWGERPARFAGTRWQAPVVDLEALGIADPALARWTDRVLVPKVVVATQTRVLEAAVDVDGSWFPSVPTLAVTATDGRLWEAAAVVLAPAVSAWAFGRHAGAALSGDAVKVSARQLLAAPLPTDATAWDEGAGHLRQATAAAGDSERLVALQAFGVAMGRAYGVPDEVYEWWRARLPATQGQQA